MRAPFPSSASYAAVAAALVIALVALSACGTVNRLKGPAAEDPLERPTQVAWTSARATRCGFIFNPNQLRANYLAAESALGRSPNEMQKIARAYDYTRESVRETVDDDPNYCNKERTVAIRKALNRYLAGDYTPTARTER